ncbi:MAG TPA: FHA domain-containing protein [Bdellovibrionota bacterium]|jgi:pSer/pThr/pTyr-binding forkhead associated (FHA) protein
MPYFLKILSSPDKSSDGLKFELGQGDNLIGRTSPPAKLKLDGTKVSKKHCVFKLENGVLKVDDLNSSNGIFVNGKKVSSAMLKEKDRLVIGEFILEVTVK